MVDTNNLPQHIAIILDGNRRWAKSKGLPAVMGHKEGAKNVEKIAKFANKIGIKYLTVYAFSTENWKRSQDEVKNLMSLLESYVKRFFDTGDMDNIKLNILGDVSALDENLKNHILDAVEQTKNNSGMVFNIAFNYGGRAEILHAVKNIGKDIKSGKLNPEDITEQTISEHLYTAGQPDPDLLIRTSGELRTSNFLPWQLVYSEFLFVDKNWPDFTEEDLDNAIEVYNKRNRKFGAN